MEGDVMREGFLWGAASSAYQVEGGYDADGRGLSKWDVYTNRDRITVPFIGRQETGNVAINQYDRTQYLKDIALMRELGLNAYRFSVSWPRVLADGIGEVNQAGLAYYGRLVDDLLDHDIEPVPTLYHWDFPWPLHERGGFRNPAVVDWFRDYAGVMFRALGDRVDTFITMNEPFMDLFLLDVAAENVRDKRKPFDITVAQWGAQVPAMHNLFLASAAAIGEYRAGGWKGSIGIALPLAPTLPVDASEPDDVAAAQTWDTLFNRWPLDAALRGDYAADVLATLQQLAPAFVVSDADRAALAANTVDFVGVNFYAPTYCRHNDKRPLGVHWGVNPDPVPAFNGPVRPDALYQLLMRIHAEYGGPPILITENGAGFGPNDEVMADGVVKDPLRTDYIRRHIDAALRARADGANLRGYLEWCPFDNFEWFRGYDARFGMIHVDFDTQQRTPKSSFHAYKAIIADAPHVSR
jgi:beta-glucosidase